MSKRLYDIDRLFKTGLSDHTEPLPKKVWDNISQHLDKKQTIVLQRKYNRLKRKFVTLLFITTTAGMYAVYDYVNTRKWSPGKNEIGRELKKPATVSNLQKAIHLNTGIKWAQPVQTEITTYADKQPHTVNQTTEHSNALLANNNFFKTSYQSQSHNKNDIEKRTAAWLSASYVAGQPYVSKTGTADIFSFELQKPQTPLLPKSNHPSVPIFLTAASSTTAFAVKRPSHFSLTLFFAPDLAFDPLNDHDTDDPPYANETNREQYASSFHTGALVNYALSENWSLQSGLSFSNFSTTIKPKTIFAHADDQGDVKYKLHVSAGNSYIDPKSGIAVGDSAQALHAQTRLQYVSVPLSVNYGVQKGAFRFNAGLGIAANWLVEGQIKTSINNGTHVEDYENDISGLKPVHLNGLASLGVEYRLTKKVWLSLTPTARIALHSINNEVPVKSYQNFLSVAAGLHTSF